MTPLLFRLLQLSIIFSLIFLYSCGSSARFTNARSTGKTGSSVEKDNETGKISPDFEKRPLSSTIMTDLSEYENAPVLEEFIGLASYYADKYNGRLTSNGEIYDMYGITAAHPDFPHNTIIRVTNLKNNKSTLVRVNDHMPRHPERLIDLSLGTAQVLDMVRDGVVKVRIEVLKWGKKEYIKVDEN